MKKVLLFICIIVFVLSICACEKDDVSSDDTKSKTTSSVVSETVNNEEFSSDAPVSSNVREMNLTEDDVKNIIEKIKRGENINSDRYSYDEKCFIEKTASKFEKSIWFSDSGAVSMIEIEDDIIYQVGGNVVGNSFTFDLPTIPGIVSMSIEKKDIYTVVFKSVTTDKLKEYASDLEKLGFDEEVSKSLKGTDFFFSAKNNHRKSKVEIKVIGNTKTVIFTKGKQYR